MLPTTIKNARVRLSARLEGAYNVTYDIFHPPDLVRLLERFGGRV